MNVLHYPWAYCPQLTSIGVLSSLNQTQAQPSLRLLLSTEEGFHLRQVLRCREGDKVVVFDGKGFLRLGVCAFEKKAVSVIFLEDVVKKDTRPPHLYLIQCLPNAVATFEEILRKACELGVKEIFPVVSERTERQHWTSEIWQKRQDRYLRILIESCKQAKNAFLPKLHAPMPLGQVQTLNLDVCLYGTLHSNQEWPVIKGNQLGFMVGPEGGFSEQEEGFLSSFAQGLHVPTCVLRSETAVVALASAIKILL